MPLAARDDRALHDQIIAHDLIGVAPEQVMRLIVVELRKLREEVAMMRAAVSEKEA